MGGRVSKAQEYTVQLCRAICRGLVKQKEYDRKGKVCIGAIGAKQLKSLIATVRTWDQEEKSTCAGQHGSDTGLAPVTDEAAEAQEDDQHHQGSGPSRNPTSDNEGDIDVHNLPEHWTDEKHEPCGTAMAHLEVSEAVIASRPLRDQDVIRGPIQFTVGANTGAEMLEDAMIKLDSCRLLSLDIDKWGSTACYDDVSGDVLDPALVQAARDL